MESQPISSIVETGNCDRQLRLAIEINEFDDPMEADLKRARLPLLPLLSCALAVAIWAQAPQAAPLPPGSRVIASDESGVRLRLLWSEGDAAAGLELPGCMPSGEAGGPMLPRFRTRLALPPGSGAELTWRMIDSAGLPGKPRSFPTVIRGETADGEPLYTQVTVRSEALFAEPSPIAVELGPVRRLRDLRVVDLVVDPVAWKPGGGMRLATELEIEIRFIRERKPPKRTARRAVQADPLWDSVYSNALLNGAECLAWRNRVSAGSPAGRSVRAEGELRLRLNDNGVYGLPGDSLIARGIPVGTDLDQIALFDQRFDWDESEQPLFTQSAVPRFFLDRNADGLLDEDDVMVFLGRRLRYREDSPDPIEWYGRGSAYWVARAPELVLEMGTESGWTDLGDFGLPASFRRHRRVYGEEKFYWAPPSDLYVDGDPNHPELAETWRENMYFFPDPRPPQHNDFTLDLSVPSPGLVAGTGARLEMYWQGQGNSSQARNFTIDLINGGGTYPLANMAVWGNTHPIYSDSIPPDRLVDGDNALRVDRVGNSLWFAMIKYWDLLYESAFRADGDSLFLHADSLTGEQEYRVGGFSRDRDHWLLLRSSGEQPARLLLEAANQAGVPGDYELRFRVDLAGGETWWALDEAGLLMPGLEEPAPLGVLDEAGAYDILAIVHDDFLAGMDRWAQFREAQGYAVKLLPLSEVWETFFSGCRGPIGIRNAARFAYQQWGIGALLLVGDACKDARNLDYGGFYNPDFLPLHSYHEIVGGVDELVGLEEWVAKFEPNAWPSLFVGRLPVASNEELDAVLDKIECYENYENCENCAGGGEWRSRFLLIADDCWSYTDFGSCSECRFTEHNFEIGQVAAADLIAARSPVDDIELCTFYTSVITDPWYEDWYSSNACCTSVDLQQNLRPILAPMFTDSLSRGYSVVTVQAHANRVQLGHEEFFKLAFGPADHENLVNWGMPFFWVVFGCHGNAFAAHNEGGSSGDAMGERLLFLDGGRGAVASYASEGFEYLFPNVDLGTRLVESLFPAGDGVGPLHDLRLGPLLAATELAYDNYQSSYRMNLLGDPLTRIDLGPPRIRLIVDHREMLPGDQLSAEYTDDSLRVTALLTDEGYIESLALRELPIGDFEFERFAGLSIDASLPIDSLVPFDAQAAADHGLSRSWAMSAVLPYTPAMDTLVVEARDIGGRVTTFRLPVEPIASFWGADGGLANGGRVPARGHLRIDLKAPGGDSRPEDFELLEDGRARGTRVELGAERGRYRMSLPYRWSGGAHELRILYRGKPYGAISLSVAEEEKAWK